MLRRVRNCRYSAAHRLPPETLGVMASYLEDDKSLIIATHVCYFWRSALISFPRLWSHLSFKNERRALMFLERSKSAPVSVDLDGNNTPSEIARESLKRITKRLTALRAVHFPFLDELLIQPLPILRYLHVVAFGGLPPIRPLAATNLGRLTVFCFTLCNCTGLEVPPGIGDSLLDLLRSCPLLEAAFFGYGERGADIEFTTDEESTEVVSLPFLRSFVHESSVDTIYTGLFNRLSLPPTCEVAFTITDFLPVSGPWSHGFPTLRGTLHLSGVNTVKIAFQAQDKDFTMVRVMFLNSKHTNISLNKLTIPPTHHYSAWQVKNIVDFLGSSGIARSVETLHFEHCPMLPPQRSIADSLLKLSRLKTLVIWQCNATPFLELPPLPAVWCPLVEELVICPLFPRDLREPIESGVLKQVRDIAVSRKKHAVPLKTFTLIFRDAERLLQTCGRQIEELMCCVESVEVL